MIKGGIIMRKEILYAAMKKAAKVVIKRGFFPGAGQMLVKVKNGRLLLAARNANEHMLVMEETDAKNMWKRPYFYGS